MANPRTFPETVSAIGCAGEAAGILLAAVTAGLSCARTARAAPKPRPAARNSRLFMRFALSFLRLRPQSGAVDRYNGVGMLLARLGRPVHISHLGDRRLGRVVVGHLLEQ